LSERGARSPSDGSSAGGAGRSACSIARWHLQADADVVELLHAEQQRIFMVESGLDNARPTVRIDVSRLVGYIELRLPAARPAAPWLRDGQAPRRLSLRRLLRRSDGGGDR
jgi:hypothetical protein